MLSKKALEKFALENLNIDKIGVANIERFKDAPLDMHPASIMPNVKSVIVFIKRIPRGCYRGIDEGTHWASYNAFGYSPLAQMLVASGYRLARFVEDHGHEGAMLLSTGATREFGPRGPKPAPNLPKREVTLQHRIAATLAGLGEIGWSKVFLTEEFGPRQRIGIVLTDAVLEPDPIVVGKLCDHCKRCVVECPAGAVSRDKSVSIEVEGHKIEWNDLDLGKCKLTHFGLNRKTSPWLAKRFPGMYFPVSQQEVTWLEAHDLGFAMFDSIPNFKAFRQHGGYPALCGARGCIIGCMKHMEKRDLVTNIFARKVFSEKTPWELPETPPHVEHHGFVYDPDTDEDIVGKSSDESKPAPKWY